MKTKLTPELQKQLIKYIEAGNYVETACKAVGISRRVFYNWGERGKKTLELEKNGKKVPESEKIYLHFLHTTRQAVAKAEIRNVTIIQIAAKKDWRAAMEILARKYPKRWGKKDKLTPETPKTLKAPPESKQVVEFRKKFELLTPEQKKQFIELGIRREKEIAEINDKFKRAVIKDVNNGDNKNE